MTPSIPTIYFTLAHEQARMDTLRMYGIPLVILFFGISVLAAYILARNRDKDVRRLAMGTLTLGCVGLVGLLIATSLMYKTPMIFSEHQMLEPLWQSYKTTFIEVGSNRTVDPSRGGITTSEGQAYTMLRAVWRGDKNTFDASWAWTRENLQRPDNLFGWLYVPPDFSFATSTITESDVQGGRNSATDADTTIALSLVFAYARWQDPQYLDAAHAIITSIWDAEVLVVDNHAYVLANNIEKSVDQPTMLVNPSYLNPAAYRIFALVDTEHPWSHAVDGSYDILTQATRSPLDASASAQLPPDWVRIDTNTGTIIPASADGRTSNFGYDAMRVIWHVTLDWQWHKEERARDYLQSLSFLAHEWNQKGALMATYSHSGATAPEHQYETPAMYGATIGYFTVVHPELADEMYLSKLEPLYDSDTNSWREELSYYDDNLAWFGIAVYNRLLPNLIQSYPPTALTRL